MKRSTALMDKPRPIRANALIALAVSLVMLAACGSGAARPTRTPIPTWTPTVGAPAEASQAQNAGEPEVVQPLQPENAAEPQSAPAQPLTVDTPVPATPVPPTAVPPTPIPPTPVPPTEAPTETPTPQPTVAPTDTPTAVPTATPAYAFALESADKFPTQALAPNVVRIWMYVYSPAELGLGEYSVQVRHNGAPLQVDEVSTEGVPGATFDTPGPYTRFTNFNVLFVEAQAGTWDVQLVDSAGMPAGPPAQFNLSADEETRELYVRYKQVGALPK